MSLTKQEFAELVAKAGAGTLNEEEAATLQPYRAKNAIILAAGACRRFAPISFDYPKSLVEVRGEVLIERQIRQLLTAGVTDITVVVGLMKEKFAYLAEKYGVTFVESTEFNTTNTLVSLSLAAEKLGNTYILLGDQYYTVNPFETYVFRPFYATTLTTSDDEWVMETGADGMVTDMVMREDGGEKLQGPCYVDAETGAALKVAIEETLADKANIDKYWEYAWYEHRDTVQIATRYYPAGVVNAFKRMDDLYAFDDAYLLHVKSPSMDNICGVLGCTKEEMYDFVPLMLGLTNYSVAFSVGDKRYVYRHPMNFGMDEFNRPVEAFVNKVAYDAGADPTFIYMDPESGWKLCRFIEGAHMIDRDDAEDAMPASALLGKFHRFAKDIKVDRFYSRWESCLFYEKLLEERNFPMDEHTMRYRPGVEKLVEYMAADNLEPELSHNDCWYANILWGDDGSLNLIDWEFAAMADPFSDIGIHAEAFYWSVPPEDHEFLRRCLREYLEREETPEEWRHFMGQVMVACWKVCVYTYNIFSTMDLATDWDVTPWLSLSWYVFDYQLQYTLDLYEKA